LDNSLLLLIKHQQMQLQARDDDLPKTFAEQTFEKLAEKRCSSGTVSSNAYSTRTPTDRQRFIPVDAEQTGASYAEQWYKDMDGLKTTVEPEAVAAGASTCAAAILHLPESRPAS
jgi:hypothetical protein